MAVRQQVLSLLQDPNASYATIGRIVGCSRERVRQIAKSAGLTRNRRWSDVTVEGVFNLYQGLLIKEIAQTLGCNEITVRHRLRQAGISKSECCSRGAGIRWRRSHHTD